MQLARLLTSDVTREFISRTRYKVVDDPEQADAVLQGTVTNFDVYPTMFDPVSGRATSVHVSGHFADHAHRARHRQGDCIRTQAANSASATRYPSTRRPISTRAARPCARQPGRMARTW